MMPQTLSTFRNTPTTDSGGATTYVRIPILVGVRASIQPDNTPQAVVAGSLQEIKVWNIFIDTGQNVQPNDTIDNPDGTGGSAVILSVADLSGRLSVTRLIAFMQKAINV